MASGLRIIPQVLRFTEQPFTGAYQKLGSPLNFACCLVKIVNNSNVLITVSWDGINDHDILPANSFALYDVCSDAGTVRGLYVAQGTQFWIKGAAGVGDVYLVAFHTSEF